MTLDASQYLQSQRAQALQAHPDGSFEIAGAPENEVTRLINGKLVSETK